MTEKIKRNLPVVQEPEMTMTPFSQKTMKESIADQGDTEGNTVPMKQNRFWIFLLIPSAPTLIVSVGTGEDVLVMMIHTILKMTIPLLPVTIQLM